MAESPSWMGLSSRVRTRVVNGRGSILMRVARPTWAAALRQRNPSGQAVKTKGETARRGCHPVATRWRDGGASLSLAPRTSYAPGRWGFEGGRKGVIRAGGLT